MIARNARLTNLNGAYPSHSQLANMNGGAPRASMVRVADRPSFLLQQNGGQRLSVLGSNPASVSPHAASNELDIATSTRATMRRSSAMNNIVTSAIELVSDSVITKEVSFF